MIRIDANLLVRAVGCTLSTAHTWAGPLAEACERYDIDTPMRLAAFLAQTGHESASFVRTVENLNYSASGLRSTWPHRFPGDLAEEYARQPERIANRVYANRLGNREEASGDGWHYRGRGLIQVTGRANYEAITEALRERLDVVPDFGDEPELLTTPKWAALSAGAYWHDHSLNELADRGAFDRITRRINGGQIGAEDRRARYAKAREVLRA